MCTSDVWSIQLDKSKLELGRPSSDADRASLLLDWLNQYSGQLFDEPVEGLYELSNGLKLYDMMRKVSTTVFSDFENLNDDPSIWVLKKSNLTTLIHSMNEFGISSLRGDSTFDLSEIVDVTKISKWSEDDEDSAEGEKPLLLLMEYVLTMCVLSGNTEILDGLRRLPKSDQHSLSATVKRVMTLHRFSKLRSYLSVHSLAVAASSSSRLDVDTHGVNNESFNFSDTPKVSDTPRVSMVSFRRESRASCVIFEDLPTARDEDSISPASQLWKPTAVQDPEALRVEMSALKNIVRDLNQDLEVKVQELAIYQAEVEALRSQNEEYKEELVQSNTRGFSEKERHLMQALSEAEEKVRTLEDDIDESKGANATMKDKLNTAVVEQERLQKRLLQIETLSSRTDEVRQSLVSQNRDLENKLKSTMYSETELKATIRQLQDEKEALELGQTNRMLDEDDFMDTGDLEATVQEKKMLMSEVQRLKSELNVANLENTLVRTRVEGDNDESEFESTARFHHARMDTLVACPSGNLSPPPKECASHQFEMTIRRDRDTTESVTRRLEDSTDPMYASLRPQSDYRNDSAPPTIESLHEVVHQGLNNKCLATVFLFTDGGYSVSCDDADLKPKIEEAVQGWRGKLDDPPVFADPNTMSGKPRQGKADARGGCAEGCKIM